ncbi:hypothetical protein CLOSBL3_20546 [Clostridiaceae bacterium BL-3]|nr:hypothetical protein CLOSBL3_20546 [Clostridiaceae bacterium BL-3]
MWLLLVYGPFYLNTSHVKVQHTYSIEEREVDNHLNTSHVKVQRLRIYGFIVHRGDLNTSHVKVQHKL